MDTDRSYRVIARAQLRGYDPATRTFTPWWWSRARYKVTVRQGGISHFFGSEIAVSGGGDHCPHVVVHSFVHEVGHVQMLLFDMFVFSAGLAALRGASWAVYVVAFLAWQFVWREVVADLYAVAKLGVRNTLLGYTHLWRTCESG